MLALISFIIATVFFAITAMEGTLTDHPLEWGFFFTALGLALAQLPYGPRWPQQGPRP